MNLTAEEEEGPSLVRRLALVARAGNRSADRTTAGLVRALTPAAVRLWYFVAGIAALSALACLLAAAVLRPALLFFAFIATWLAAAARLFVGLWVAIAARGEVGRSGLCYFLGGSFLEATLTAILADHTHSLRLVVICGGTGREGVSADAISADRKLEDSVRQPLLTPGDQSEPEIHPRSP